MKIDKNKLLENFKNIKNIINFEFLKCYNKLFNKKGILNNIGFFILLAINLFHILSILIFIIHQFSAIINKIKNILDLSHSSETPLDKKIEIEEKIVKPKTSNYKDKQDSIHKNKKK